MNITLDKLRALIIGFYAWIAAIMCGQTMLDMLYAKLLSSAAGTMDLDPVFSSVSDFFLLPGIFLIFSAPLAIAAAWKPVAARNLLIASALFFSFVFSIPIFFSLFSYGPNDIPLSPWFRLLPQLFGSLLALTGFWRFSSHL
jgi:hypothetical protein